ncbi:helix-turn-helix transcriptional regulator [Phytohabitans sp. ZYX-F-186]|uniref:Helix-turn-helix transcriptional regulator n=1 Tax=Phytohabitans maris TaxID=3071409 RepID=A0ABU0ZC65_9ACTN|nr:helix-turn-helix transcriptional regulator [Phytohabitans sp. ZYX-F-186]MDQ7903532.1 helix-turn-helix transcriptional regulator [Phytohabitans sp. ZYX-F-186]
MTSPPDARFGGPTALRMILGAQLRRLREANGISREQAGWEIRASESKISRLELGRVGFKERDVADLLTLYNVVDGTDRAAILSLVRQANSPGWWHEYTDILPYWFSSFLGLEAAADHIDTYETQLIPGLLQTRDYARAVVQGGDADADDSFDLERRVDVRMTRQQRLAAADGLRLRAVLDEAVLRRAIGGAALMRAQIAALIEASTRPNIRLHVLPFRTGVHSALIGSFTILGFPEPDMPDVVYIEHATGAIYLDRASDVDTYLSVMRQLAHEAEPSQRTADLLHRIMKEL